MATHPHYALEASAEITTTLESHNPPSEDGVIDFARPWDLSDLAFVVEGQRIHVSKTVLAMWSPVMKAMFTDDFKASPADCVKQSSSKILSHTLGTLCAPILVVSLH